MAYIKYKELTKYINFNQKLDTGDLPKYVTDYVDSDEKIIAAYKTSRDKSIFTNKRMILFDVVPFTGVKRIHILPYKNISTATIEYDLSKCSLFISYNRGYQLKLNFVHMNAADKTDLRILYSKIMKCMMKVSDK